MNQHNMKQNKTIVLVALVLLGMMALGACERTVSTVTEVQEPSNCFACHSDQDTKLVSAEAQYDYSIHASGNNIDRNNRDCKDCHISEGFVARAAGTPLPFGDTVDNPTAIHCFTCHAPHTNSDFRLRAETVMPLKDGTSFDLGAANMCVWCHQASEDVNTFVITANDSNTTSRYWGPHHSTQGDMLLGSNGYEFSSSSYSYNSPDFHKSATFFSTGEPIEGCRGCHFKFTSNYRVGGHSFNMAFDDVAETFENTTPCEECHGAGTDFNRFNVQDDTDSLLVQLKALLISANLLDSGNHPIGRVVAANDSTGAIWNYLLSLWDGSKGVHNRTYIHALLKSSIEFMGAVPVTTAPMAAQRKNAPAGSR